MTILEPTTYLAELRRKGEIFLRGKNQKIVEFSLAIETDALEWLERQFKQFPATLSFQTAEAEAIEIPASPKEAIKALELLQEEEWQITNKVNEFNLLKSEVDILVKHLYDARRLS